ncbi:MAG TPA: DUF1512 domain-containing protein [Candidatus Aenigmarchaeota archaeon]|nr:DUF1512 domain-containing protein [Candidatus Aenigmarchaeota archaeon]
MFAQFDAIGIILFFILIFLFPRIMMYQILAILNSKVKTYEEMTNKAQNIIINKIGKRTKLSKKELRKNLSRAMEFFAIEPDSIDPFGIAKKIRYITRGYDVKLEYFVENITFGISKEEIKNLSASLSHTIGLYQITKIIRHFIELIKQTKNFQIGMLLQMQLPFIDRQMQGLYQSIPALTQGIPVGDSIGPLYAAKLIGNIKVKKIGKETVYAKKKINEKEIFIIKASGPEARLGDIEEAIKKIVKRNKIDKIITIDASGKLEGEKTGIVAEGIGFAMGLRGAERFFAETFLVEKNIPVDAIVIKMKPEEALMPMPKEVLKTLPLIDEAVKRSLENVNRAIIVGVGLTIGVGNNSKEAEIAEKNIMKYSKKIKKKKEKKKKFRFLLF